MKILLKENQLNDLRKTLSISIEENGLYETLRRYNLNLRSLSFIFKGEELPEITCDDLYVIIYHHENFIICLEKRTCSPLPHNQNLSYPYVWAAL